MREKSDYKRIVFLIGSMRRGGAERVISILANNYAQRGWKVDVLLLLDNRSEYELNVNVRVIPICNEKLSRIRQLPRWLFNIRRYVIKNNPDRIVSFIARINIITILACVGLNKKVIISERNDPVADGRTKFARIATHILYPRAHCVVFQTKWAQSCFSKKIQNNSVVIQNPVHVTQVALAEKAEKIVAVGRLLQQKNHAMLINAFKKVHEVYPKYKLYIYGEGGLREALTKQIQLLELEEYVFLPGNKSNIHEEIADAEIFVLSSNYEGLSNALLEAMMMGLSCISTDCAGSTEVIINEQNGIIVHVGNDVELYNSLINLIANKEMAIILGENGKKSVQYMKIDNILLKWQEIIEG